MGWRYLIVTEDYTLEGTDNQTLAINLARRGVTVVEAETQQEIIIRPNETVPHFMELTEYEE